VSRFSNRLGRRSAPALFFDLIGCGKMRTMREFDFLYFLLFVVALAGCNTATTTKSETLAKLALIPMPVNVEPGRGYFVLREGAALNVQATNAEAAGTARYFADLLARTRGIHLDVRPFGAADA